MSEITKLEPKLVWELFDAITRVPRPSKKEEKIREFLVDFAKKHNIDYQTDETSNVVMRVPGTKGYENRPCVILQSHMDMVEFIRPLSMSSPECPPERSDTRTRKKAWASGAASVL